MFILATHLDDTQEYFNERVVMSLKYNEVEKNWTLTHFNNTTKTIKSFTFCNGK